MGEFAGIADVELAWNQAVPDDDAAHVDYLIGKAERLIKTKVRSLAFRLESEAITEQDVIDVVCEMVLRILRNPGGYRYEMAGDYAYQRDTTIGGGVMLLTSDEQARLAGTARAQTLRVGDDALTRPHRRQWLPTPWVDDLFGRWS